MSRHGSAASLPLQIALDFFTIMGGFYLSYLITHSGWLPWDIGPGNLTREDSVLLALLSALLIILIFAWQKVYNPTYSILQVDDSRRFVRAVIMGETSIFLPFFYAPRNSESLTIVTAAVVLVPMLLAVQKSLFGAVMSGIFKHPRRGRRLLILGNGEISEYLLRRAVEHNNPPYEPVGLLDNDPSHTGALVRTGSREIDGAMPVLGTYSSLPDIIRAQAVDEVWINDSNLPRQTLTKVISDCETAGAEVAMIPSFGGLTAPSLDVSYLNGIPIMRAKKINARPIYELLKRMVDFVAATLGLLAISPLFLLLAALVKLDSRGPALFRQARVGYKGRQFKMFKFRTMFADADPYAVTPQTRDDPRITRFGRFLRRTSLDELPQILNVLTGEMSLVGPRPEMPFIVAEYNAYQRLRLEVIPGITGLWQISGDRSIPIHQNLDYDLYYIDNRSALLDLVILWRTVWTAVKGI